MLRSIQPSCLVSALSVTVNSNECTIKKKNSKKKKKQLTDTVFPCTVDIFIMMNRVAVAILL